MYNINVHKLFLKATSNTLLTFKLEHYTKYMYNFFNLKNKCILSPYISCTFYSKFNLKVYINNKY